MRARSALRKMLLKSPVEDTEGILIDVVGSYGNSVGTAVESCDIYRGQRHGGNPAGSCGMPADNTREVMVGPHGIP